MRKEITIEKECTLPGTDIVLEKGDKIKILKERFDAYYTSELNKLLPLDEYGVTIQLKGSGRETKWMNLTIELINTIRDVYQDSLPII